MKKVVSPCFCKVYTRSSNGATARAFCEIQFENGRLSITGVIGPMPNGNCRGGAGLHLGRVAFERYASILQAPEGARLG